MFGDASYRPVNVGHSLAGALEELRVDAEPGGRVGGLTQQARRQARVHAAHALLHDDGAREVEAGLVLARRAAHAAHLHPVLEQVQRLHEHGGRHAVDVDQIVNVTW